MKKIIKLNHANIILITKLSILIVNLLILFFIYNFYKNEVITAIVVDEEYLISQSMQIKDDINIEKFNETIKKLDTKHNNKNNPDINNFFETPDSQ